MSERRPPADLNRDELYALAREREIPGRSSMSKEELREALATAADDSLAAAGDAPERSEMSSRSIWSGTLSFGLVTIPVGLHTAVEDRSISFHLLDERDGARIRYRKVNEQTGEEVEAEHIVKGYPVGGGQHVTFSDEELDNVPSDTARAIDVVQFVDAAEIDP